MQVLTVTLDGHTEFEEIFMFSHQSIKEPAGHLRFELSSGEAMSATAGHYLWASRQQSDGMFRHAAKIYRAKALHVGDFLWNYQPDNGTFAKSQVAEIRHVLATGLINPHTFSGTIVVDNVAALTFTESVPPAIFCHKILTLPVWMIYKMMGANSLYVRANSFVLSTHPEIYLQIISAMLYSLFGFAK